LPLLSALQSEFISIKIKAAENFIYPVTFLNYTGLIIMKGGFKVSDIREEIYLKYKANLYSYFYGSTLNTHISEELTGDTFLKAFKYFSSFKGEASMKTWLFKIARNILINYINKEKKLPAAGELDDNITDNRDDYKTVDEKDKIRKVLFSLKEEDRTVIVLKDMYGLPYGEIGKVMNINEGQVKTRLFRARKRFKDLYFHKEQEE
jgi:RNA polymerase sigma-70 factor, ECF subfamily